MKSKPKALIVDDEAEICFLMSRILRNRGVEVACANSLSEARSVLASFEPSVIFLDNHLPDGWGVEFSLYLKKKFPHIRIIIITAKETNIERAFENGASDVIFKPFSSERIISAIS